MNMTEQQSSIRKKRKLPKRDVSELKESSPDINVPIPGSETWISPTAIDSPNNFFSTRSNNKNNHITVGTPTKSRSRHYSKPLSRPSENFAERLQRAFSGISNSTNSGGNCETLFDNDFMAQHSIVPILERQGDAPRRGDLVPDENSLPEQTHQQQDYHQKMPYNVVDTITMKNDCGSQYNVISRQVKDVDHQGDINRKDMRKSERFCTDSSNLPDEKTLTDIKVQVVVKQLTKKNEGSLSAHPLTSPRPQPQQPLQGLLFSHIPDCDSGLTDSSVEHISKEQKQEELTRASSSLPLPQQIIQIPVSERIQTKLNKRKRKPGSLSPILVRLRKGGLLEWTS